MATRAAKLALRGKALSDTGTEIGIVNNADATAITIDSNEKVGIGTASPTGNLSVNSSTVDSRITLTDSTTGANTSDGLLLQSGAANAYLWNYEAGNLIVGNNNAEAMRINSAGIVTKPLQPAFLVQAGSNSALPLLVGTKVNFNSEIFDQNSDFNTTTQTFTAPVTGKYQFNVQLLWVNWDSGASYYYLQIVTSNRTYYELYSGAERSSDVSYCYGHVHVLADMDAGDTAHVSLYQNQGTSQTTYDGQSVFTGHLAC